MQKNQKNVPETSLVYTTQYLSSTFFPKTSRLDIDLRTVKLLRRYVRRRRVQNAATHFVQSLRRKHCNRGAGNGKKVLCPRQQHRSHTIVEQRRLVKHEKRHLVSQLSIRHGPLYRDLGDGKQPEREFFSERESFFMCFQLL